MRCAKKTLDQCSLLCIRFWPQDLPKLSADGLNVSLLCPGKGQWEGVRKALQLLFSVEWAAPRCPLESPSASPSLPQTPPARFRWEVRCAKRQSILSLACVSPISALDGFLRSQFCQMPDFRIKVKWHSTSDLMTTYEENLKREPRVSNRRPHPSLNGVHCSLMCVCEVWDYT